MARTMLSHRTSLGKGCHSLVGTWEKSRLWSGSTPAIEGHDKLVVSPSTSVVSPLVRDGFTLDHAQLEVHIKITRFDLRMLRELRLGAVDRVSLPPSARPTREHHSRWLVSCGVFGQLSCR